MNTAAAQVSRTGGAPAIALIPVPGAVRHDGFIVFAQGHGEHRGTAVFEGGFRADLIVNDAVIVEVEAARALDPK